MNYEKNYFLSDEVDPLKDMAIDEFLSTPIDSRTSSTNADFSKPSSNYIPRKKNLKKRENNKDLMKEWDKKLLRLSKNIVLKPRVKSRNVSFQNASSLTGRELFEMTEIQRPKTSISYAKERPEIPPLSETSRSSKMPLRKNEVPIGRRVPDGLIIKHSKNPYE